MVVSHRLDRLGHGLGTGLRLGLGLDWARLAAGFPSLAPIAV
jgi:hypothetical protein